jgi:hypothetical protein
MSEDGRRIAEARARFARSLVGVWSGAVGTSSTVGDEIWMFMEDGTGLRRVLGPLGDVREEVRFLWRSTGERTIETRIVAAAEEGVERDVGAEERGWLLSRYDFRAIVSDTGTEVAMVETSATGDPAIGFGDGMIPLAFRGPPTG